MRNIVKLTKGITTVQTPLSLVNIVIVLLLIAEGGGGGGGGGSSSVFWIYILGYHSQKKKKKKHWAPSWQLCLTSEVRGGVNFPGLTSYQTNDPFF